MASFNFGGSSFNQMDPRMFNPMVPALKNMQQMQGLRQQQIETGMLPQMLRARMFSQEMGPLATLATSPYFQALMQQGGNPGAFNNIISGLLSSIGGQGHALGMEPVSSHAVSGPMGTSRITSYAPEHQSFTSPSDILAHAQAQAAGRTADPVKNESAQQVANWNLIKNEVPQIEEAYRNVGQGDALLNQLGITNDNYRRYETMRNILSKQLAPYGYTAETLSRNTLDSGEDSANRIRDILNKVENKYAPAALDNIKQAETGNYDIKSPAGRTGESDKSGQYNWPTGTRRNIGGKTYISEGGGKWRVINES